MDFFIVLK